MTVSTTIGGSSSFSLIEEVNLFVFNSQLTFSAEKTKVEINN
jgi:hypothetical protein